MDRRARALIRLHAGLVRRLARERSGLPHVDLLQEGYLGLVRAAALHRPWRGDFAAYAEFWIRLTMAQAARRESRASTTLGGRDAALPSEYARTAEVRAALADLPPRERDVLRARFYGHCTYREIGADLGVSPERARQLAARGLRRLAQALDATSRHP